MIAVCNTCSASVQRGGKNTKREKAFFILSVSAMRGRYLSVFRTERYPYCVSLVAMSPNAEPTDDSVCLHQPATQQEDRISYSRVNYLASYFLQTRRPQRCLNILCFVHVMANTRTNCQRRSLYLESRMVRVKQRRYLKMAVESCNFRNSSSLCLKRARAKRNMICGGKKIIKGVKSASRTARRTSSI